MKSLLKIFLLLLLFTASFSAQVKQRENGRGFSFSDNSIVTISGAAAQTQVAIYNIKGGSIVEKRVRFCAYLQITTGVTAPSLTITVYYGGIAIVALNNVPMAINMTNRYLKVQGTINVPTATSQKMETEIKQFGLLTGITTNPLTYTELTANAAQDQFFNINVNTSADSPTTQISVRHFTFDAD